MKTNTGDDETEERQAIQLRIEPGSLSLPQLPAVYAIFSPRGCRYIGETDNLQTAVNAHFHVSEPNVSLRYFMQSERIKVLQYRLTNGYDAEKRKSLLQRWIGLYCPADREK